MESWESPCPAFQQVQAEEASSVVGFVTGEQRSHVQCCENEQPSLSCLTQSGNVCSEPFLEHKKVEGPRGWEGFLIHSCFYDAGEAQHCHISRIITHCLPTRLGLPLSTLRASWTYTHHLASTHVFAWLTFQLTVSLKTIIVSLTSYPHPANCLVSHSLWM